MSKRPSTSSQDSRNTKRKHLILSVEQSGDSKEIGRGMSVKRLSDEFPVGISTIYNIRRQRE
jgi:transposase